VRPLSFIAIGVSVTAVGLGARVVTSRRAHAVEPRVEEPAPEPPKRAPVFQPAPSIPRARSSNALAHLRGRVIAPAGVEIEPDDLTVKADDGEHEYEAATAPDGRFQLHLPARGYTITASTGDLVGVVTERARPGADEEVTIRLQPAATIQVVVDGEVGNAFELSVTRAGSALVMGTTSYDDGGLLAKGLVSGAVYDVTVSDEGRETVIRGVTAPSTVHAALPQRVTLRGAIGFAAATKCPFQTISLVPDDDEETRDVRVDTNCRFAVDELDPGTNVHLRASGQGWHLDEYVPLPATGEPELACLNPPCRDLPPVIPAELEVILTGAPARTGISARVESRDHASGCEGSDERCEMPELAPDSRGVLTVRSKHCSEVTQPLSLSSGHNTVTVACQRMRLVEGIVRNRDRRRAGVVSCADGGHAVLTESSVFELRCPEGTSEITFRTGPHSVQATAPVPPGDPAFVELTL
jgi:hypothetical protein